MTPYNIDKLGFTPDAIEQYLNQQTTKPGRKVIWNSYSQGTYIKAIHGPIGSKVHKQS